MKGGRALLAEQCNMDGVSHKAVVNTQAAWMGAEVAEGAESTRLFQKPETMSERKGGMKWDGKSGR